MSEQKQPEPLWSDERIGARYMELVKNTILNRGTAEHIREVHAILMYEVRDAYEAALAERGEWQPLADGMYRPLGVYDELWISGSTISIPTEYGGLAIALPDNLRLCRQRPQPAPASAVEQDKEQEQ